MPKSATKPAGQLTQKRLPSLPSFIKGKLYKTGQTRGAESEEVYQNRVNRNNTVIIPYSHWDLAHKPPDGEEDFENGYIVLISPEDYFENPNIEKDLSDRELIIGGNTLIFYQKRSDWIKYKSRRLDSIPASSRSKPLGGGFIARIVANTSKEGEKILEGFTTTKLKGAGIRSYEYASSVNITRCRDQLECLFWFCEDSIDTVVAHGMKLQDAKLRREGVIIECERSGLWNTDTLIANRILNKNLQTICPLCLLPISARRFVSKVEQAEGREVASQTVTQINLFHITELRVGKYEHRPYNLAWGHYHCNTVVKDDGIPKTLKWMKGVIDRNIEEGYMTASELSILDALIDLPEPI